MDMMSEKVSSSLFAEVVLPVLGADGLPKRSETETVRACLTVIVEEGKT